MSDLSLMVAALAFGGAFLISWCLTAFLIHASPRLGLVDHPSDRKLHKHVTPKGGGLAIYAALVATSGLLASHGLVEDRWVLFLGVATVVVLLGLLDDLYSLSWQVRLGVQTGAALLLFGWPVQSGWLPPVLALVWVVGLLNAFNMLDNMDGLSGGVAWVTAMLSAGLLLLPAGRLAAAELPPAVLPYLMLAGALLGFLCFNRPPARIYLGDAGSTLLGFFFGIRSLQDGFAVPDAPASWAVPLCLLAVPWYDLITVVALRVSQGRSPFHADKQHLSHRLVEAGLRHTWAVAAIILLALASGAGGLLLSQAQGQQARLVGAALAMGWIGVGIADYLVCRNRLGRKKE